MSLTLITGNKNYAWAGFSFAQVSTASWLALAYLTAFGSMVGFAA